MNNEIQFLLYQLPDEDGKIQVVIKDETIWATQKAMAQLFDVGVPDISKHLKKKFETGELEKEVVVSKMEIAFGLGIIFLVANKRAIAGALLALFYVAIFPGNINQYVNHIDAFGLNTDNLRLIRLFFQPVLIFLALWTTGGWKYWKLWIKGKFKE